MEFLSKDGLKHFLDKLKGWFVSKSEFRDVAAGDKHYSYFINARLVYNNHVENSNIHNYDLRIGRGDANNTADSYIQLDSTKSESVVGGQVLGAKEGVIMIFSPSTIRLKANNKVDIQGRCDMDSGNCYSDFNVFNGVITSECDDFKFSTSSNGAGFSNSDETEKYVWFDKRGDSTFTNFPKSLKILKNSTTPNGAMYIEQEKIRALNDNLVMTMNNNIKFKTSSSNTMRLTEGEGFKVFANMYAEPDHATDIAEYSDKEKKLLSENTVQRILLGLANGKANVQTVKKIAKQTIQEEKICVRRSIRIGSVGHNVKYFHNKPCIKLKNGKNYRIKGDIILNSKDVFSNVIFNLTSRISTKNVPVDESTNIYKIPVRDASCNEGNEWNTLFFLKNEHMIGTKFFTTVERVEDKVENGISFTEVTLKMDINAASTYSGKTASPYFMLTRGVVGGAFVDNRLPFTNDVINNTLFDYHSVVPIYRYNNGKNYQLRDRIAIYTRRCITKEVNIEGKTVKKTKRKYVLANRANGSVTYSSSLRRCRGEVLLKYYRKGIMTGTRRIYIHRVTKDKAYIRI